MNTLIRYGRVPHQRSRISAVLACVFCAGSVFALTGSDRMQASVRTQFDALPNLLAEVGKLTERVRSLRRDVESAGRDLEKARGLHNELEEKLRDAEVGQRKRLEQDYEFADARLTAATKARLDQEGRLRPLERRLTALTGLRDVGLQVAMLLKRRERQQLDAAGLEAESDKTRKALLDVEVELIAARELMKLPSPPPATRKTDSEELTKPRVQIPDGRAVDGERTRVASADRVERLQQKVKGLELSSKDLRRKWNQVPRSLLKNKTSSLRPT